ncbi:conserved hypothetical protein [Vibrio phage KVP40]|uniref:Uncharacterized protein n=2 Tax=Schizotequatrovirus KVP40 TaxID=1914019 RepID=Q6WIB8_BPKVM|nr:hypothetical protein KVP40.0033 [Vibrio phage KVP40]QIW91002.1 hypothetical protein COHAPHLL_00139 [Vibrio phage V09]UNA01929.1 hypothetical protein [Vibrio phage PC-Liy1]URQ03226.1 hypothetical protein PVA8_240 [Vibrio phage PVA8]WBM58961.1 hypothetical protein vBValMPVA8_239 [Vibrio phage vB_ValM_PVA8]AAQ64104.1 conserved hypothetical protein [Vibrio phage KVP40]
MNVGEFVEGLLTLMVYGIIAVCLILVLSVGGLIFGTCLIISGHTIAGWVVSVVSAIIFAFICALMRNL